MQAVLHSQSLVVAHSTTEHYDRARGNRNRHGVHFLTAYVGRLTRVHPPRMRHVVGPTRGRCALVGPLFKRQRVADRRELGESLRQQVIERYGQGNASTQGVAEEFDVAKSTVLRISSSWSRHPATGSAA